MVVILAAIARHYKRLVLHGPCIIQLRADALSFTLR